MNQAWQSQKTGERAPFSRLHSTPATTFARGLLLDAIYAQTSPEWLRQLPAVEILRQVWVQQFYAQA